MSLRTRFFALFTLLAVIPLVAVGGLGYMRSKRAVEALVATQVQQIARAAARQLADRYALHEANLLLLARNAETQRLFAALDAGDSAAIATAASNAETYLDEAWRALGSAYAWIEVRDVDGRVLRRLGGDPVASLGGPAAARPAAWLTLHEPIVPGAGSREAGAVFAAVLPDAMLPYEALETRFGASGYSVVVDRSTGRVLYHPRHAYFHQTIGEWARSSGWNIDPAVLEKPEGTFTYREGDSSRVAFFQSLGSPPWTVLASGSVDEFGGPFARSRATDLAVILLLTIAVWIAYTLLARRATDSLATLTAAADRVGAGDYTPDLPKAGHDEVGRLTTAFQLMVTQVRESLQQMETSRQMAAVGAFASQISHEIRNPLTSLQMNLQGLQRDVESGRIPPDLARPVQLSLKEVHRLDGVVSGVLSLARPRRVPVAPCSLHRVIDEALDLLRAQLAAARVTVLPDLSAPEDTVLGDGEALKSVFLNLCLNGAEAMPGGGTLCVITESAATRDGSAIRVQVEDDGAGVPSQLREDIFKPFFSTKTDGTGIGLSLAARIIEEHRGTLVLAKPRHASRGSAFVIELPLVAKESHS